MKSSKAENRRVRFSSIQGIEREDLPLAAEIWYSDIVQQDWASREVVKLAILFNRYLGQPKEDLLSASYIERSFNMDVRMTLDALRQMQMFGVVEAFSMKDAMLHVSLYLSLLQRLRTLEVRTRLLELSGTKSLGALLQEDKPEQWEPPAAADAAEEGGVSDLDRIVAELARLQSEFESLTGAA
jgi:hypothetical protein